MMTVFFYYLIGVNAFVFLLYGYDKWLSRRKGKRIAERTLHQWTLLGGEFWALFWGRNCSAIKNAKKVFSTGVLADRDYPNCDFIVAVKEWYRYWSFISLDSFALR
jgi:uncharacterized membrane protein YsdA (DUF1294 family)